MGTFRTYRASNDKEVTNEIDTIKKYYTKILQDALKTFKLSDMEEEIKEKDMPPLGENWKGKLLGTIQKNEPGLKNLKNILHKIAEEEKKYYYKWNENNNPVKDEDNNEILNQMGRVNIINYYRIFSPKILSDEYAIQYENTFKPQCTNQGLENPEILLPIQVVFSKNGNSPYDVYIKEDTTPLFLDQHETTNIYSYRSIDDKYSPIITSKVYQKTINPNFINSNADDESLLYFPRTRLFSELFKKRKNKSKFSKILDGNSPRGYNHGAINNTYYYSPYLKEPNIPLEENFRTQSGVKKYEDALKDVAEKCGVVKKNQSLKFLYDSEEFKIAHNKSCNIFHDYYCFYYIKNDQLESILSNVSIAGSGMSGGNYAMRADKLNEVNYEWCYSDRVQNFQFNKEQSDLNLAKLLRAYMGLDPDKKNNIPGNEKFYPTNWPRDSKAALEIADKVANTNNWFKYYKQFKPDAIRRNCPANPDKPRSVGDLKNKTGFKLDNYSYRVWKKGQQDGYEGEKYGGETAKRLDAASVMAEAIKPFTIYNEMKEQLPQKGEKGKTISIVQVSDIKLPATAFAHYLTTNDANVIAQWKKDNKGNTNLKTNQEWCHLFGHGDGGPEELGNFVSGSNHCNTEQLAIEIGQRKITHNADIPKEKREKLRAKITAYLMPNSGAWIENKEIKEEDKDNHYKYLENLEKSAYKIAVVEGDVEEEKEIIAAFFIKDTYKDNNDKNKYRIREADKVSRAFENLSKVIRKETDKDRKKQLFEFRRYLEQNFFLQLPLARYMRYKIYYDNKKVFDHIYDAQSQSFDFNEAQILDYTVERVLYYALGLKKAYMEVILERTAGLFPEMVEKGEIKKDELKSLIELNNNNKEIVEMLQNSEETDIMDEDKFNKFQGLAEQNKENITNNFNSNSKFSSILNSTLSMLSQKRENFGIEIRKKEREKIWSEKRKLVSMQNNVVAYQKIEEETSKAK